MSLQTSRSRRGGTRPLIRARGVSRAADARRGARLAHGVRSPQQAAMLRANLRRRGGGALLTRLPSAARGALVGPRSGSPVRRPPAIRRAASPGALTSWSAQNSHRVPPTGSTRRPEPTRAILTLSSCTTALRSMRRSPMKGCGSARVRRCRPLLPTVRPPMVGGVVVNPSGGLLAKGASAGRDGGWRNAPNSSGSYVATPGLVRWKARGWRFSTISVLGGVCVVGLYERVS